MYTVIVAPSRDLPKQFEGDTEVVAEVEVLMHMDDVVDAFLVLFPQCVQDLYLDQRLVVKPGNKECSFNPFYTIYAALRIVRDYTGYASARIYMRIQASHHVFAILNKLFTQDSLLQSERGFIETSYMPVGHFIQTI